MTFLLILVAIIVTGFLYAKSCALVFDLILESMKSMFVIIVPLSILSLINKRFFGRLVCVVNENGLYCNQKMLQWSQIKSANYNIFLNSSQKMGYSSVKIEYGHNLSLIIPHAPRSILKEVIKYSPKAKVGFNTGSKFMLGLTISSSILIPICIFLVEAALKN